MAVQDIANQDKAAQSMVGQDTAVEDTAVEDTALEDTAVEHVAVAGHALAARVQSQIDAGDLDGALCSLEQAFAADAAPVEVAVRAAEAALKAKRFDLAERLYARIIDIVPDHATLRLHRGYALQGLNRLVEAHEEVARSCALAPDLITAQTSLGYLCHMLNRYEEAADAFERGALAEPDNARAWVSFGESLSASYGRFEEAAAVLAKATTLASDNQDLQLTIANSHIGNGAYADAEALIKRIFRDDPDARRSPMPNVWLGFVVRCQGRETEAMHHYANALAACEHLIDGKDGAEAITYRAISAFVLYAMGKTAMAETAFDALCLPGLPPEDFVYDHESYLPNTFVRIERLARLVGGRDIALLLYGPSARQLEARLDDLRELDVCFASVNKFDEVESRLLAPIDRTLDLVVAGNPNDLRQRWSAFHNYLQRPVDNMLMLTEHATIALPPPHCSDNAFVEAFDPKLLYFHTGGPLPLSPLAPLNFWGGNTLSIALPLLALGGPRRIFIFGADGGAQAPDALKEQAYVFGETAEVDASERRQREANRRFANEARQCDHNAPFSVMAIAKLFRRDQPKIYNCCPHSNYQAFERISVDQGLRLLKD